MRENERDAAILNEKTTFGVRDNSGVLEIIIGKDFDLAVTF